MATNNSINTGPIASLAEATDGVDTRKLITPYTANQVADTYSFPAASENIGFTIGGGLLTICSADGTALSGSNKGLINVGSKTYGRRKVYEITSNQILTIADMSLNTFGIPTNINSIIATPFWIYAVVNDAENSVQFMLGRLGHLRRSPASTSIGMPSAANANTQGSMFSFANITATEWDLNPCIPIGMLQLSITSAWVYTLGLVDNGGGGSIPDQAFGFFTIMQQGTFGASTSTSFFIANGGTIPTYTTRQVWYGLLKYGKAMISSYHNLTSGGSGAVNRRVVTPYAVQYPDVAHQTNHFASGTNQLFYNKLYDNYKEFRRSLLGTPLLYSNSTNNQVTSYIYLRVSED